MAENAASIHRWFRWAVVVARIMMNVLCVAVFLVGMAGIGAVVAFVYMSDSSLYHRSDEPGSDMRPMTVPQTEPFPSPTTTTPPTAEPPRR